MKIHNVIPPVVTEKDRKNINSNKQNVAFGGVLDGWKPSNLLDLSRQGTMKGNLFIANAFVFLLGSRIITSRDKDERREILIRDIPTIILAVMGVPWLEKGIAGTIQKASGFAITESSKNTDGIINAIRKRLNKPAKERITTKTVNYSQLEDWYKFDNNIPEGMKGFSKRLDFLGGDLKKIYSHLGEEVKSAIAGCKDNKAVIDKLAEDKGLADKIAGMIGKNNPIMNKAKFFKTLPTITGFAGTLLLIGLFIPKMNIFLTETLHKNKKAKEPQEENISKTA